MEQEKKTKKDKKQEKPKKSIQREIFEWIMVFVVAAALAFVVRTFIFEPVRVDGSSMLNTLTDGEYMIATKFDYLLGDLVQMRKTHPCGSDKWTVIRVGADIKIRCSGCSRIVMMDRADFMKRMKKIIAHSDTPIRGTNEFDEL